MITLTNNTKWIQTYKDESTCIHKVKNVTLGLVVVGLWLWIYWRNHQTMLSPNSNSNVYKPFTKSGMCTPSRLVEHGMLHNMTQLDQFSQQSQQV